MNADNVGARSNRVVYRDVVCPFCAGACDDLQITVEDDRRIVDVQGGCKAARDCFGVIDTEPEPLILVDGRPAALDEAVNRAAQILAQAQARLIFGLERLTCEAQSLAVALADRLGATIDSMSSLGVTTRGTAAQQVGESTCTLGDLRDRADFVLFWEASGEICQLANFALGHSSTSSFGGSPARRTLVVLQETIDGSLNADFGKGMGRQFATPKDVAFEAVCVLRALIEGLTLDAVPVLKQTGIPLDDWSWLAGRMKSSEYGVIVGAPRDMHVERALNELVIELNQQTRFAYLNASLAGMNGVGAEQVLTWRSGYPYSVNFAAGYPRFGPREYSTEEALERGEADAVLAFGIPTFVDQAIGDGFLRLPRIVLANHKHEDDEWPTVFVRTAQPGLHTAGTVFRFDGVPLPLRKIVDTSLPAVEDILKKLLATLGPGQQMTHAKTKRS